jgi:photosystem II stability/assembly factor-like uncharacterized protein
MSDLLIATDAGILRFDDDGAHPEPGPESAAFLARGDGRVFAATAAGAIWRRYSAGTWSEVNPRAVDEEIWSFAADPRLPGRLYLGVSPALLYRSDDGGVSWTACESVKRIPGYETWTFPPPPHIPHVRSIAADPEVEGGVYIGVEEGGVFRSPDGGQTWQSLNEGLYWDVHTVVPARGGNELYATTGAGFHVSTDAGGHWRHVRDGITNRYTVPLLASQAEGRLFTAAAAGPPPTWSAGTNAAIYRSDDRGNSWRRLEAGLPPRFEIMVGALVEDDAGRLYAAAGGDVYRSENAGVSWQLVAGGLRTVRALALS